MTRTSSYLALAIVFALSFSAYGQTYTNVSGFDLDFTNIVETSGGSLFGQPNAIGNDLNFPNTAFSAESVSGGVDFLNGMVELNASSNTGMTFSSVSLDEFGVYFTSPDADSLASVDGFLTVVTPDGSFSDSFSLDFENGEVGNWTGQAFVSFPETTTADVFIHNILFADSDADGASSISKRDVTVTFGTAIPEPSTFGLLLLGVTGLASRRRR